MSQKPHCLPALPLLLLLHTLRPSRRCLTAAAVAVAAADYGFDPLRLGSKDESVLKYYREGELMNGRWAMAAVAGACAGGRVCGAGGESLQHACLVLRQARPPTRSPPLQPTLPPTPPPPTPASGILFTDLVGVGGNWWEAGANVQSSFDLKTLVAVEVALFAVLESFRVKAYETTGEVRACGRVEGGGDGAGG